MYISIRVSCLQETRI